MEINDLLDEVSKKITIYLNDTLPQIDENWWENLVLQKLSYSQKRQVEVRKINNIEGFDLAALLKIFTSNWRDLSDLSNLPMEVLNYAKELQTIRNIWAHRNVKTPSNSDLFRYYDTIERYLKAINKSDFLLYDRINSKKISLLVSEKEVNKTKNTKRDNQIPKKLSRSQAFELVNNILGQKFKLSINKKQFVFSNKVMPHQNWWFEPRYETFENDLYIALNNQENKNLILFKIPAKELFPPEDFFRIRKELNNKPTINISGDDILQFQDKLGKKKVSFIKYYLESIDYN